MSPVVLQSMAFSQNAPPLSAPEGQQPSSAYPLELSSMPLPQISGTASALPAVAAKASVTIIVERSTVRMSDLLPQRRDHLRQHLLVHRVALRAGPKHVEDVLRSDQHDVSSPVPRGHATWRK